jgi:fibronectin-binding autotransporter adhesin
MKIRVGTALATLLLAVFSSTTGFALTNAWNTGSGKWEIASNWTLGTPTPPPPPSEIYVGNVNDLGFAAITIDSATVQSNAINQCLTIADLTILGSTAAPRQLLLLNNFLHPLTIEANLTIRSHGSLVLSNAAGLNIEDDLFNDGAVTVTGNSSISAGDLHVGYLASGTLLSSNASWTAGEMNMGVSNNAQGTATFSGLSAISLVDGLILGQGSNSSGIVTVTDSATMTLGTQFIVGNGTNSSGVVTVAGDASMTFNLSSAFIVGNSINSSGSLWLTGGTLNSGLYGGILGEMGSGQMTMSNAAIWNCGNAVVLADQPGSVGTLTVAGGTLNQLADEPAELIVGGAGTGTVWITGGNLSFQDLGVGSEGIGQMAISNGTVGASSIYVGGLLGSDGTLTVAGGTVNAQSLELDHIGDGPATVWLTGGELVVGDETYIAGDMTVSNGVWQADLVEVGNLFTNIPSTLILAGGSNSFSDVFTMGLPNSFTTGVVWMTGGQLGTYNAAVLVGLRADGAMAVSNGVWSGAEVDVGVNSAGTLTLAGGTATFTGAFDIGALDALTNGFMGNNLDTLPPDPSNTGTGTVWLTGAQLTVTGEPTHIGERGIGRVTMSAGGWMADEIDIGVYLHSQGTLTMQGGQLTVTNAPGQIAVGGSGVGHMIASGGTVVVEGLSVGAATNSLGELTMMAGSSVTVLSNLTVGDCTLDGFGLVEMDGGALYVTNSAHNAVLEIRNGLFQFDSGTLVVDTLVGTNLCGGIFDHVGGTLSVGTLVLDPNGDIDGDGLPNGWEQAHGLDPLSSVGNNGADGDPDGDGYSNLQEYLAGSDPNDRFSTPPNPVPFRMTAITQQGANILLTWMTPSGTTNQVQVAGGSYATNSFLNLGPPMFIGGSGVVTTNYTEIDGATNRPARYYRVWLVP